LVSQLGPSGCAPAGQDIMPASPMISVLTGIDIVALHRAGERTAIFRRIQYSIHAVSIRARALR
jgi:hypothetical protein